MTRLLNIFNAFIDSFIQVHVIKLSFSDKPNTLLGVKIQGDEGSKEDKIDKNLVPMELQANEGDR